MTVEALRSLLRDNGVEFYIKKQKGGIVKIHVLVEDSDNETDD